MVKAKKLEENEKMDVQKQSVKVSLEESDSEQLFIRDKLMNGKKSDLQKLQLEIQILDREIRFFYNELLKKYDLPIDKHYKIEEGCIVEI